MVLAEGKHEKCDCAFLVRVHGLFDVELLNQDIVNCGGISAVVQSIECRKDSHRPGSKPESSVLKTGGRTSAMLRADSPKT